MAKSESSLDEAALKARADQAMSGDDLAELQSALEAVVGPSAETLTKYRLRLAHLYIRQKAFEKAEPHVEQVLKERPDLPSARIAQAEIYWLRCEYERAIDLVKTVTLSDLENPRHAARCCTMIAEVGGPDAVCDFLRELQAAGGDIKPHARESVHHRLGDASLIEPLARQTREGARLVAREVLNAFTDFGPVIGTRLVEALAQSQNPDNRAEAVYLQGVLESFPGDNALRRPLIKEAFHAPVSWSPEASAGQSADPQGICVVFSGGEHNFAVPSNFFDRYLAARGLAAVYLRDHKRLVGHAGIEGLGPDRDSAALALRDQIRARGYKRIYTIGISLGGFWAFSYGLVMEAEAMIGFGAMTYLDEATMTAMGETRAPRYARRLWEHVGQDGLNLAQEMAKRDRLPDTHLVFGQGAVHDPNHAHALAGFDQVKLHPIRESSSHAVSMDLMRLGLFEDALDHILPRPS